MFYYNLILTYLYQTIVHWAAQLNYRNVTLKARTYIDKVKTAWKRCHGKSFKRPSSCWGSSFGKVKYCKYISQKELTLRETQRVSLHIIMLPTTLYSVLDNCHGHMTLLILLSHVLVIKYICFGTPKHIKFGIVMSNRNSRKQLEPIYLQVLSE